MKHPLRILVPTDFTATAWHALSYVLRLSTQYAIHISLLHVVSPPIIAAEVPTDTEPENEPAIEFAQKKMDSFIMGLKALHPDITCKGLVETGFLQQTIVEEVKVEDIDMVVFGARQGDKIHTLLLGSLPAALVQKITCPFLIVPEKADLKDIKKIVYATNMLDDDISSIAYLAVLAKGLHAELNIIHISVPEEHESEKWLEIFETKVRKVVNYPKMEFENLIGNSFIVEMVNYIKEEEVDLLAMMTIKRTPFESLYHPSETKNASHHVEVPLMVFQST